MNSINNSQIYSTAKYIVDNNINLFSFYNINEIDESKLFNNDIKKKIRHAYKKNCIKYHVDKYNHLNDEQKNYYNILFNLNKVLYDILSNKDYYFLFNQYTNILKETDNNLKDNYNLLNRDDIKQEIKKATNGKTFEQLFMEMNDKIKESNQYNYDEKVDINESLQEYKNKRNRDIEKIDNTIYEKIKNYDKEEFLKKFNENFQKNNNIDEKNEITEIVAYNDNLYGAVNNKCFDLVRNSYDTIYNNTENIIDQWKLPSADINLNENKNKKTFEELIKEREKSIVPL